MVIKIENLKKSYKDKVVLNGVNLSVKQGEILAVLGKNGAGKSTLIKTILGFSNVDNGKISVFEQKPGKQNCRIGYLSENITLYPYLSAADNIRVAALSANVRLTKQDVFDILKKVNLEETGRKEVKNFSLGMKRRLQLAISTLVKEVDLLILDEPTNGLDVNGMLWFKNYLTELKKQKRTVVLASHSIFDLQKYITNYVILNKGRIVKEGIWNDIQDRNIKRYELVINNELYEMIIEFLRRNKIVFETINNSNIIIQTELGYKEITQLLFENKILPENLTLLKDSLEDLFLETVEE